MTGHPRYGELRTVTAAASVLLQNNPGMMTLDGTNTWVLRAPDAARCVVVDPGEVSADHVARLSAVGAVELILITHHHHDHYGNAPRFAELTGAPVRAFDGALCLGGDEPLRDGEQFTAAGLDLRVLHTPGHTADSVSVVVGDGAVLTGDTILGRGTTVLSDLGAYLGSLRALAALPAGLAALPGHGPELPDVVATAGEYLAHREQRLDQVRRALVTLGADATVRQVVELVYADVDPSLWPAADHSVQAQLDYLRATED